MSALEDIANTMSEEFRKAVRSAEDGIAHTIDGFTAELRAADDARHEGMQRVETMRREAARLLAESLRVEQETEAQYHKAKAEALRGLGEVRAELAGAPGLKAIPGGREHRT